MQRARQLGLIEDKGETGPANSLTDVPGVQVGHVTIRDGDVRTGVTALLPHPGNVFLEKVPAAVEVINGFGKSAGLMQIQELGNIETPLLMTNTFGVGSCINGVVRYALGQNPDVGRKTSTVNPIVTECNDGYLSDIQALAVREDHVFEAIAKASSKVEEGSVGAGTGMTCFGFKGGIGTASRRVKAADARYTLGVLTLTNFGSAGKLTLPNGKKVAPPSEPRPDQGSVIIVIATDAPLESRQLKRIARRAGAGLARLGSYYGHGSGDVVIAFSTQNRISHYAGKTLPYMAPVHESYLDGFFEATANMTVEAVLNSMTMSPAVKGFQGHFVPSLFDSLA